MAIKKISIITPLYNGKIFEKDIINNAQELYSTVKKIGYTLELICVNDNPKDSYHFKVPEELEFKLIQNETNQGIQKSRVNGLLNATGEYIIFLDQDDKIISENFINQLNKAAYADVVIGNLYKDLNKKKKVLYKRGKGFSSLFSEQMLLYCVNTIISPGQCLIRRKSIPSAWCTNIMKKNGADDLLLWLLLYENGAVFTTNDTPVYYHRTTEIGNLSSDDKKMFDSEREMIDILTKCHYSKNKIEILQSSFELNHNKSLHVLWKYRHYLLKRGALKISLLLERT